MNRRDFNKMLGVVPIAPIINNIHIPTSKQQKLNIFYLRTKSNLVITPVLDDFDPIQKTLVYTISDESYKVTENTIYNLVELWSGVFNICQIHYYDDIYVCKFLHYLIGHNIKDIRHPYANVFCVRYIDNYIKDYMTKVNEKLHECLISDIKEIV